MKKSTNRSIFKCQSCGYQTPKWMGKCPDCNQWDTLVEEIQKNNEKKSKRVGGQTHPIPISQIEYNDESRIQTLIQEFDRVLGGGIVPGSIVLIGGDPGIGKSTLILQVLHKLSVLQNKVLYISGEESPQQLHIRGRRLDCLSDGLLVHSETEIDTVLDLIDEYKPAIVAIDSVQTMYCPELSSIPGSVSQVRETTMRLMMKAKHQGISFFLIGHVTKDGAIAGPKVMEHMVDTVLYFEGDRHHVFRILRSVKNRFGSTHEIGVFEMKGKGLLEVKNPSSLFLSERPLDAPGSVVTASLEGTRPILTEIQALASRTNFSSPRRTILGLDQNRVILLAAVMEKKLGMHLMGYDLFMNVAGGVKIDEPGLDLGAVCAIASSFLDKFIAKEVTIMGEVGLTGEVRAINQIEIRIGESQKMGFTKCLVPKSNLQQMQQKTQIEIIGISTISEAIEYLF